MGASERFLPKLSTSLSAVESDSDGFLPKLTISLSTKLYVSASTLLAPNVVASDNERVSVKGLPKLNTLDSVKDTDSEKPLFMFSAATSTS